MNKTSEHIIRAIIGLNLVLASSLIGVSGFLGIVFLLTSKVDMFYKVIGSPILICIWIPLSMVIGYKLLMKLDEVLDDDDKIFKS